jgi:malonyl-CoA O-methyltransferase
VDDIADRYEQYAVVSKEIGARLVTRLDYLKIEPNVILDLGCGTGWWTQALKVRFPQSLVVALDVSRFMLQKVQKKQSWFKKQPLVQADMHHLPFANESIDLIFANQVLLDTPELFDELHRVLSPNACFMFSTLGPDTLKEIEGRPSYVDLHDIGDALLKCGFQDPVMDREDLCLHYPSLEKMQHALASQGLVFELHQIQSTVMASGKYPLTYEIIYGHAWRGRAKRKDNAQVISIEKLKASISKKSN